MNNLIDEIKNRRSVRSFKNDMPDQKLIDEVIEAGLYAASSNNTQETIVIEVTDKNLRNEISKLNGKIGGWKEGFDPFYGAPIILIVLGKKVDPNRVYNGSLVLGNMMLEADSLGLGSCWIHRAREEFKEEFGKDILKSLNIDDAYEGIGHLAVGIPKDEIKKNKEIKENRVYKI